MDHFLPFSPQNWTYFSEICVILSETTDVDTCESSTLGVVSNKAIFSNKIYPLPLGAEAMFFRTPFLALLAIAVLMPSIAQAQLNLDVILAEGSNVGGTSNIVSIGNSPRISENGQFVGIEVNLLAPTDDAALIIDLQNNNAVTLIAQEGITPVPGFPGPADLFNGINGIVEVNNSGQAVFFADTELDATMDQTAFFFDPTAGLSIILSEGDATPTGAPFSTFGTTFAEPQITNAGVFAGDFDTNPDGGAPTSSPDDFLQIGSSVLFSAGDAPVSGFTDTNGGSTNVSFTEFELSGDGTQFITEVDTSDDALTDQILVVNGNLIAQEGVTTHTTPGGTSILFDDVNDADIASSGDYIAEVDGLVGGDTALTDYILVNGEAVEAEGELAPDGTTFVGALGVDINSDGDYLTTWDTSAGVSILLLNSEDILLTEGDILNLDFDGDGIFEDLVVDVFNFEDVDLADDGTVVLSIDFNALDGSQVGDALVSFNLSDFSAVAIPEPSSGIVVALTGLVLLRRRRRVA